MEQETTGIWARIWCWGLKRRQNEAANDIIGKGNGRMVSIGRRTGWRRMISGEWADFRCPEPGFCVVA
jgi:hypothetical protein